MLNLFDDIDASLPDEVTQTLLSAANVRIERIISTGQASPPDFWYDQDEHEWVLLLAGSAGLQLAGENDIRILKAGDFLCLPAHQKHRVAWTDSNCPTIWLAIFFADPGSE
ncbi:MAG: hypothetical protein CO186_07850 [Zetaproteobacteria bacterium CG_4_9_14_3_um_filter_49_83]|nr:MAG: hypothetical protein AUJ56_10610 [Zetaproteobacteria bacterium CG1_02_49_23]PIQ33401.1 MAG: hypothetical protein COW62_05460 [Zetaproteobacteria bacterium CG17_big_fil_post_rev_8_21_14_2_50_50_13]PIV31610.1 MAG: hypothetical protein COS35_00400 [Zetaproteobacteria bacterium CG02_land_8_20_14_3_00_50_9]PIY55764.1 MAG: hypothetical protein COZ00_07845 [Zetaproteobacteria bacterium CG_4_10_14_0_8_um_filter_49_80]PJA35084.1 MAG: hypothetical protein CO186_07850 [Zetaproteobacteria bacterium